MTDNEITLQAEAYDATDASKKLSEASVIKALEYCCGNVKGDGDEECNETMCYQVGLPEEREGDIRWCRQWLIKDALDLINRIKGERDCYRNELRLTNIEKEGINKVCGEQKVMIEKLEKIEHYANKTIEKQSAEIERLQKENEELGKAIASAYELNSFLEASRKCVRNEAIKEFAERLKNKMIAKHKNIDGFCVYEVDDEQIDNLVKEMTEERDNA